MCVCGGWVGGYVWAVGGGGGGQWGHTLDLDFKFHVSFSVGYYSELNGWLICVSRYEY